VVPLTVAELVTRAGGGKMTDTRVTKETIPQVPDPFHRLQGIRFRHIMAEQSGDVDAIMETVAEKPRYVIMRHGLPIMIAQDRDAVRQYYEQTVKQMRLNIAKTKLVKTVATDWYYFVESVAGCTALGEHGGVDRTGQEYSEPVVAFQPLGPENALMSEFTYHGCTIPEAIDCLLNEKPFKLEASEPSLLELHQQLVATLQAGDAEGLRQICAPNAIFVNQDFDDPDQGMYVLEGIDAIVERHKALLARAPKVSLTVVSLIPADWYVFAEYSWTFEDADGNLLERRRTGQLYSHNGRSIFTSYGYGRIV
jgi:hypothetical protein